MLGTWISTDGPFNEHLIRDVGAMYLALGIASVGGLVWHSPAVFRILGLAWTVFGVLHLGYHAMHLDHMDAVDAVGSIVSLSISLALGVVLLIPGSRSGGAGLNRAGQSRADAAAAAGSTGTGVRR